VKKLLQIELFSAAGLNAECTSIEISIKLVSLKNNNKLVKYTCTHYLTNFNHFWHRDYKEVKIM